MFINLFDQNKVHIQKIRNMKGECLYDMRIYYQGMNNVYIYIAHFLIHDFDLKISTLNL